VWDIVILEVAVDTANGISTAAWQPALVLSLGQVAQPTFEPPAGIVESHLKLECNGPCPCVLRTEVAGKLALFS
jgi:hypothetical protein